MLVISACSLFPIEALAKESEGQTDAGITYYEDDKVLEESQKPTQGTNVNGGKTGFLPRTSETDSHWSKVAGFAISGLALLSICLLSNDTLLDKIKNERKEELS